MLSNRLTFNFARDRVEPPETNAVKATQFDILGRRLQRLRRSTANPTSYLVCKIVDVGLPTCIDNSKFKFDSGWYLGGGIFGLMWAKLSFTASVPAAATPP